MSTYSVYNINIDNKLRLNQNDVAAGYVLVSDATGLATWTASTASTPNLQQVLNAGSTLTGSNSINPNTIATLNFGDIFVFDQLNFYTETQTYLRNYSGGTWENSIRMDSNYLRLLSSDDAGVTNVLQLTPYIGYVLATGQEVNFGIGTAGPSNRLHVFSTTPGAVRIQDGSQVAGYVLTCDANGVGYWSASVGGSVNANNGVTISAGIVQMGGTLIQDTTITNATYSFTMSSTYTIDLKSTSGMGQVSRLGVSSDVTSFEMWDWGGGMGYCDIRLFNTPQTIGDGSTNNQLVVRDQQLLKGLVYDGNYTANFTTYSLVTKGYVDSLTPITAKIQLNSTEVQSLNTSPKVLVGAPGTGKYIEILTLEGSVPSGTAYTATYSTMQVLYNGSTSICFSNTSLLLRDANPGIEYFNPEIATRVIVDNADVLLTNITGNPDGGSFGVDIYLTYIVRTL